MSPSSHGISASLTSSSDIGMDSSGVGGGLVEHNIATYASLFGSGVITLITLLFVRVADQDTLLGFRIQLPSLLLWHMHIRDAIENPQVSKIQLPSEIQLICRHLLSDPILDVDRGSYRFGPIKLGHALFFQHCPCRFHNRPILPFGYVVLLRRIPTTVLLPIPICCR